MSETAWRKEPPDSEGWWWLRLSCTFNLLSDNEPSLFYAIGRSFDGLHVLGYYDRRDELVSQDFVALEWQKVEGPKP